MKLTRRDFLKIGSLVVLEVATATVAPEFSPAQTSTITIDDFVRKGYQSLASKALDELNEFGKSQTAFSKDDAEALAITRRYLAQIKATGKPVTRDTRIQDRLERAIGVVDRTISRELVPDSPLLAIGMATFPVRGYFGINSVEEWLKQAEINGVVFSDRGAAVIYTEDRSGNPRRVYQAYYNPNKPAHSVVINIHEVYHTMQHGINKAIISILRGLRNIKGYDKLKARISGDVEISKQEIEASKATSALHFLNLPHVQEIAAKEGVDMPTFKRYLAQNIPRLEILHALLEGEAYNAQYKILEYAKDFDEKTKRQYRLIALLDILSTPLMHPNTDKYVRGIGLGEIVWGKREVIDRIIKEPEKIGQILRIYIK